jgi:hypothetical protein
MIQTDEWTYTVVIHTGVSLSKKQDEALTHTTTWRDLEDTVLSKRSRHKEPVCDSIDRMHPEQANPETGSELMGTGGLPFE